VFLTICIIGRSSPGSRPGEFCDFAVVLCMLSSWWTWQPARILNVFSIRRPSMMLWIPPAGATCFKYNHYRATLGSNAKDGTAGWTRRSFLSSMGNQHPYVTAFLICVFPPAVWMTAVLAPRFLASAFVRPAC